MMTVRGPVDAGDLGVTLPHEHVFLNLMNEYKKDGVLNDERLAVQELKHFVELGGRTIVDCTSMDLDRDPRALLKVAEATGLNLIMGCGHYRDPYIDQQWVDCRGVDELAADLVREIEHGFQDTGIRPGVIGEVGSNRRFISSVEERVLRVAGKAHCATGLTITTHAARWPLGIPQLDVLEDAGVDPRCVVIGHCDMVPSLEYHEAVAARGAFVEFDTIRGINQYQTTQQVDYVMNLVRQGRMAQILISHDVCLTSLYTAFGGEGYTFILRQFIAQLRAAGLNEEELQALLVDNPARALTAGQGGG